LNHLDISEICTGMILDGRLSVEHVNPMSFAAPYDEAVKLLKTGNDLSILYDKIGLAPVKAATDAAHALGDKPIGEITKLLDKAYAREELALILERQIKKLHRGDDADFLAISGALEKHISLEHRYETADKIDPTDGAWVETGYEPFDKYMGGIPKAQLTVIGATTGIGKTSLMVKLAACFAKRDKKVLIYSLEQTSGQVVRRLLDIAGDGDYRKNINLFYGHITVDELVAEAGRIAATEELGFIGVDFADLLTDGESDEPKTAHIYSALENFAVTSGVPVILLSQLHRYESGLPRINNIRWSGMAEACAGLIALLFAPQLTYGITAKKDSELPIVQGRSWIIMAKSRFGFKMNSVGAVSVPWNGTTGWGDGDTSWKSLTI
jgi:replicative DNA helicase